MSINDDSTQGTGTSWKLEGGERNCGPPRLSYISTNYTGCYHPITLPDKMTKSLTTWTAQDFQQQCTLLSGENFTQSVAMHKATGKIDESQRALITELLQRWCRLRSSWTNRFPSRQVMCLSICLVLIKYLLSLARLA
jgi:hypothetical protein